MLVQAEMSKVHLFVANKVTLSCVGELHSRWVCILGLWFTAVCSSPDFATHKEKLLWKLAPLRLPKRPTGRKVLDGNSLYWSKTTKQLLKSSFTEKKPLLEKGLKESRDGRPKNIPNIPKSRGRTKPGFTDASSDILGDTTKVHFTSKLPEDSRSDVIDARHKKRPQTSVFTRNSAESGPPNKSANSCCHTQVTPKTKQGNPSYVYVMQLPRSQTSQANAWVHL